MVQQGKPTMARSILSNGTRGKEIKFLIMRRRTILLCLLTLSFITQIFGQNKDDIVLTSILKNQKNYFNKLPKEDKHFYVTMINLAKWVRPKVFAKIDSIDSNFGSPYSKLNIFEGYDFAHGNIYGLIWEDSVYYEYINNPSKIAGNALLIAKKLFSELNEEEKEIVLSFNNWENKIFRSPDTSTRHVDPPSYYLASKMVGSLKKIQTIAFCY